MNLDLFDRFSKKYSNIKIPENPSSGNRDVPCGRTDRQTDVTKLIVALCNIQNAPTKTISFPAMGSAHQLAFCRNCYMLLSYNRGKLKASKSP